MHYFCIKLVQFNAYLVSKHMLGIKFMNISWVIAIWRLSQNTFDNKSTLVQVMDWCCQVPSHCLSQCSPMSMSLYASQGDNELTLYVLNFSEGIKHIFTLYVISPHWHDTGSWNHFSSKTRTHSFYIINIMGADVLATQGARASATMIFPMLNWINSVPTR